MKQEGLVFLKQIFPGVYTRNNRIYTLNSAPGNRVYGEKLLREEEKEFREWDPFRSKLAAGIKNGLKKLGVKEDSQILYLGAATGTTASHLADVAKKGVIVCVDFSTQVMKKLIPVCEKRGNMVPVLGDANNPKEYEEYLSELSVDVLYQDVAQPNQAEIFLKNAERFLEKKGTGFLAVKARSVDVVKNPSRVFRETVGLLEKKLCVEEVVKLAPYEKDHVLARIEKP